MKNIVKTIILIISIILLYLQFRYVNKVNNKFDILQVDNPNKTQFENILKSRSPTVFTDVSRNFYNLQKYSIEDIMSIDGKSKTTLTNNITNHFNYYNVPMAISHKMDMSIEKRGVSSNIKRQCNYRLLMCQLKGVKRVLLFSPNQRKYLYPFKDNKNISEVNFFETDMSNYPNLKHTKFIEIILYPGHMLYIPFKWWYTSINDEDSFTIYSKSDNLFSYFLRG